MKSSDTSRRRRAPTTLVWNVQIQEISLVRARGRVLALFVQQHVDASWVAAAIETSRGSRGIDAVFDDHAHANLGEHPTAAAAKAACLAYAKKWCKSHRAPLRCVCTDIAIGAVPPEKPLPQGAL